MKTFKKEYEMEDIRLISPPMEKGVIKVKFNFLGNLPPRIRFDPEEE